MVEQTFKDNFVYRKWVVRTLICRSWSYILQSLLNHPCFILQDLDFVLLACDGIWDVLNNQQVCDFVVDKLAANTQPEDICEQLMDRYIK